MKNEEKDPKKSRDQHMKVSEPESVYSKKRLRAFGSFEEMNEADAAEMASISGIEHLMHVTAMLKRIYANELKSKIDLKLHRKEGWTSY